ncbi:MAG: hypothetical protein GY950_17375 [bacterium]|nr:hypothetical protein [bacterium]
MNMKFKFETKRPSAVARESRRGSHPGKSVPISLFAPEFAGKARWLTLLPLEESHIGASESNTSPEESHIGAPESNTSPEESRIGAPESNTSPEESHIGAPESNTSPEESHIGAPESMTSPEESHIGASESMTSLEKSLIDAPAGTIHYSVSRLKYQIKL